MHVEVRRAEHGLTASLRVLRIHVALIEAAINWIIPVQGLIIFMPVTHQDYVVLRINPDYDELSEQSTGVSVASGLLRNRTEIHS